MNKSLATFGVLLAFTPFLIQCASQQEVQTLSYQLRAMNKKLEDMQANTVGEIQQKQASSSGQLTEMQQEILALKGELESTSVANRQLQEQNKALETTMQDIANKQTVETESKITQLNEQLKQQQDSVAALHEARAAEAERKAKAAADAAEVARLKAKNMSAPPAANTATGNSSGPALYQADRKKVIKGPGVAGTGATTTATAAAVSSPATPGKPSAKPADLSTTPPPAATKNETKAPEPTVKKEPATPPSPGDELFQQAQKKYEAGNYQNAYDGFSAVIEKDASGPNAVQARYMMGESLYQQKEYDQAILQYQKIISGQPKNPKASAALLKQGMAFEQLADKDTAKVIYQKIISAYGSSPEADQAKSKLEGM